MMVGRIISSHTPSSHTPPSGTGDHIRRAQESWAQVGLITGNNRPYINILPVCKLYFFIPLSTFKSFHIQSYGSLHHQR